MKSCARGRPYAAASEAKTQGKEIEVPEATSSIDDTTTAVRVFGGYRAGKFFAVEFGVGDFGEITATLPNGDIYTSTLAGLDVNRFGILPLADEVLDLYLNVGITESEINEAMLSRQAPLQP